MYMLENLQNKFKIFINDKKWNRFMEDRCLKIYHKLIEVEKKYDKDIVDIDNKAIIEVLKKMSYQVIMQEIYMVNQIFEFLNSNKRVSINDFNDGRCNYIFLDENLKVYGASNLTGNKETVAKLFDGSRDILIPVHLLGSITDEVINQVMDDKVMTKNV